MARKAKFFNARFEQVLLYADGPQVILLKVPNNPNSRIIAVAIRDERMEMPFFGAQISIDQFYDYMEERFDLRYILMKPYYRHNFTFDLADAGDDGIELNKIKLNPSTKERYLPDSGLFARDHTEEYVVDEGESRKLEAYGVDGSWDLQEFSHFYGQITDMYAMFHGIDLMKNQNTLPMKRQELQEAFIRPFQGGGSYVSLYDSLAHAQPRWDRLHVHGISYNSPGFVKIEGAPKPLITIREAIKHFSVNSVDMKTAYKHLYAFMSINKLLRMPSARFHRSPGIVKDLEERARKLADWLKFVSFDDVFVMSSGDILITCKVLLSFYRRIERLYEFFLEGRASLEVPTVPN